jgi:seryl-tRNA synthetase
MFDIKWIRENAEAFDAGQVKRGSEPSSARLIELDDKRRSHVTKLQEAQETRNAASKEIGKAKAAGEDITAILKSVENMKSDLESKKDQLGSILKELNDYLMTVPNVPDDEVPEGADESGNLELSKWGEVRKFDFPIKDHAQLGEDLDNGLDFATAAKLTGSRFVVMHGALARLHRALIQLMLDTHTQEHGYSELNVPYIVNADSLLNVSIIRSGNIQYLGSPKIQYNKVIGDGLVKPYSP